MKNHDIYQKNPLAQKLVNEGVASVNDSMTPEAQAVLRYELETFVCDGQYEKGMLHILETYLGNIEQAQQPAVWVSGFYGSGKSHLVKMLRAVWMNTAFSDGATARGITHLPESIQHALKELDTQGKRHGGVHAASGTLGAAASGSVRLALLKVVFKSVGLPDQYPVARLVLWLRQEGIEDEVRGHVEQHGYSWEEELENYLVAEGLAEALVAVKPNLFSSSQSCIETLNNLYPHVSDISSDDMLKVMKQALSNEGKFPLTLIVLDEVQQYIGENSQRSIDVQEVVEACSKNIGGKLLFIATGQTAVTGTSNLKKLEGRFTVRIELSDADVDAVIRKVILAKNAEAKPEIEQVMQTNLGEVSRHLTGTTIAHRQADVPYFVQDYPILPVRRRFWENCLRVLDQTGTDSQLRNQLSMIHKVIQTNLDKPLGNVVCADYLYFDAADKLLQSRTLPRRVHEKTMQWLNGSEDEKLLARASGIVFLVNKLARQNTEIGIKATVDTIADLLVEDLSAGSAAIRSKLPRLLEGCELLMRIDDEYRIQTEESAAWNDDFESNRSALHSETHRIEAERDDRIKKKFAELVGRLSFAHGDSKVPRTLHSCFESQFPSNADEDVVIWIRDGWSTDPASVKAEARQAGNQSPVVFVFVPKRSADDLRHYLVEYKAALATLEKRGVPNSPEGTEARAAMETIKQSAEGKISELLEDSFSGALVLQGGGTEVIGSTLKDMIFEAAEKSLERLYPQFRVADNPAWAKVYEHARKGAPDALKAIGYEGEIQKESVCKQVLSFLAAGKRGSEVRSYFEGVKYGWPRDAIDGALQVLLVAGAIRAEDERGKSVGVKDMDRKSFGKAFFRVEAATISTPQRIQIRKLFQKMEIQAKQGDELSCVDKFLEKLAGLVERAGGEEPKPKQMNTLFIDEIRLCSGNERLLTLFSRRDEISGIIDELTRKAEKLEARLPHWLTLERLLRQAEGVKDCEVFEAQTAEIKRQRQLLDDPDPVEPLLQRVTQALREKLNEVDRNYAEKHAVGMSRLSAEESWNQLEPEQRYELLSERALHDAAKPEFRVQSPADVLQSLESFSLARLEDRIASLPNRFGQVLKDAVLLCEPESQEVELPKRTLKSEEDLRNWLEEVEETLQTALQDGPVIVR